MDGYCPEIPGNRIDNPKISDKFGVSNSMDKNQPPSQGQASLSAWLGTGVGMFVVLGSVALMALFQHWTKQEERTSLESLGRNNALFLEQSKLARNSQMAERMGLVMGAKVDFVTVGETGFKADGQIKTAGNRMSVGFPLPNGQEVWFSRSEDEGRTPPFWKRIDAWLVLVGFWAAAGLFSWWLGQRVARPLKLLAISLPGVAQDKALKNLPESGPAEIVALAETLRRTHDSILLERDKRRQAERLALLGQMAASLAHEVRNPVAAIRLHGQLLERAVPDGDKASVELIIAEAERIEGMVAQWLGYAKPAPVSLGSFSLRESINETSRAMELRARHAGVEVRIECANGYLESVEGDGARLRQVFGNLLLNAIQAMPRGGKVVIRLKPDGVEFADEGQGFSERALACFGEAFHSEREGGMGLGLAVSKEIIEAHGARLTAENRPDGGALVRVRWPQTDKKES